MLMPRFVVSMFSAGILALGAGGVSGQDYPSKPIRIITGGTTSPATIAARFIAQGISGTLGQQVIVDSRGSGVNTGEIVLQAPPDGHTLVASASGFWVETLTRKMPYDVVKDFAPISILGRAPFVLVVHPSLPVKSVRDLVALAKARPGELNYSIGGVGGATHLTGELFKAMAGVNIVAVPYKSGSQEIVDLIGGQVQLTFNNPAALQDHVKSGKLKILAVASAQPSALVPGVPTVTASGLPGYEAAQMSVIFARAKTPEAIINRLNQEIVRFLKTTEARDQFLKVGVETVGSSPEELAATMKSELARLGKIIKDLGIKAN